MKHLKVICSFCLLSFVAQGQSYQELNINNLKVGFNAAGDFFCNTNPFSQGLSFNNYLLPLSVANLWIGGFDQNQILHISAQTYRQTGSDFWAGPLDTTGNLVCDSARNIFYNKVWKLNCNDVDSFYANTHGSPIPGYNVPLSIQDWPGNGNSSFGEGHYLAPFVDVDGDGFYNWVAGDYPMIRGQQSLFYVYNDTLENSPHTITGGMGMGVEIRAMPYAFNLGWSNAVSNSIFIHYTIINRSNVTYDSTIVGIWSDLRVGMPLLSNHCGSDSILNCFYKYDSTIATGIVFLNQPMAGFIAYENTWAVTGNPTSPLEYYQYLQQHWKDNSPMTFSGNGYGGTTVSNWMYSGNPATGNGWNATLNFDQANVGAGQAFTFLPGMEYSFDIALVFAIDSSSNYSCVSALKQSIQEVKNFYANENQFCLPGVTGISGNTSEESVNSIFPNPSNDKITFVSSKETNFKIWNSQGQMVMSGKTTEKSSTIDISSFSSGIYFLQIEGDSNFRKYCFIKTE